MLMLIMLFLQRNNAIPARAAWTPSVRLSTACRPAPACTAIWAIRWAAAGTSASTMVTAVVAICAATTSVCPHVVSAAPGPAARRWPITAPCVSARRDTLAARTRNAGRSAMAMWTARLGDRPASMAFARTPATEPVVLEPIAIYVAWHPSAVVRATWPAIHLYAVARSPRRIFASRIPAARMPSVCPVTITQGASDLSATACLVTPAIRCPTAHG